MTMDTMMKIAIGGLALAVVASGCAGTGDPTLVEPTTEIVGADPDCPTDGQEYPADARPASAAQIDILSPGRGEIIRGSTVQIRVELTGACILARSQRQIRPDTGHVHIALNVGPGGEMQTLELFAGLEYDLTDVEPGRRILEVEFSAADHLPFNPPVLETVTFQVLAE